MTKVAAVQRLQTVIMSTEQQNLMGVAENTGCPSPVLFTCELPVCRTKHTNEKATESPQAAGQAALVPAWQLHAQQQRLQQQRQEEFQLRRKWSDLLQHLHNLHKTRFHCLLEQAFGIVACSRSASNLRAGATSDAPAELDLQQPLRADLSMPLHCLPEKLLSTAHTSSVAGSEVTVMQFEDVTCLECLWGADWHRLHHKVTLGCPCPDRVIISGPVKLQWWSKQPDVLQVYLSSVRCEKSYGRLVWGPVTYTHPPGVATVGLDEGLRSPPMSGDLGEDLAVTGTVADTG